MDTTEVAATAADTMTAAATRRTGRGLIGLLIAETISLAGSRMSLVALPWFTLATTGSATKTGLVAFAEMLPYVVACGLGGPLIDRIGARRMSIVTDLGSGLVLAAIPLLYRADLLPFSVLLAVVAGVGWLRGLGDTAKRVVFPKTVAASGMSLTRATSLHDGLSRLATLLGAPLAGLLIAALDAPTVLLIDAATFVVGAVVVASLVPSSFVPATGSNSAAASSGPGASPGPSDEERKTADREPYLVALRAGLSFLRQDRLVRGLVVMLFVTNLADAAYSSVLSPIWAKETFGSPTALGFLSASFAVGAVLGNIVFTAIAPRVPRFAVFTVGFLIAGAPRFVVLALVEELWVIYVVAFVGGLSIAAVNPILGALSYERIPEHLQARVLGLMHAVSWAGIPLGSLLAGLAVQGLRLPAASLLFGLAYLVVTLLPLVSPVWRTMDRPRDSGRSVERVGQQVGEG
ncbi:MFS transporter [Micromonospora sp. NPDC003197]